MKTTYRIIKERNITDKKWEYFVDKKTGIFWWSRMPSGGPSFEQAKQYIDECKKQKSGGEVIFKVYDIK